MSNRTRYPCLLPLITALRRLSPASPLNLGKRGFGGFQDHLARALLSQVFQGRPYGIEEGIQSG